MPADAYHNLTEFYTICHWKVLNISSNSGRWAKHVGVALFQGLGSLNFQHSILQAHPACVQESSSVTTRNSTYGVCWNLSHDSFVPVECWLLLNFIWWEQAGFIRRSKTVNSHCTKQLLRRHRTSRSCKLLCPRCSISPKSYGHSDFRRNSYVNNW